MLKNFIAVAIGGAAGAMLRYGLGLLAAAVGCAGNLATLLINVCGSFALGMLTSCCRPGSWLLFAGIGVCGSFTTFSTYSVQSVTLLQQGRFGAAALYIIGTVCLCLLFAWLGIVAGQKIS